MTIWAIHQLKSFDLTLRQIFLWTYRSQDRYVPSRFDAKNAIIRSIFLYCFQFKVICKKVDITKRDYFLSGLPYKVQYVISDSQIGYALIQNISNSPFVVVAKLCCN